MLLKETLGLIDINSCFRITIRRYIMFLQHRIAQIGILLSTSSFRNIPGLFSVQNPVKYLQQRLPERLRRDIISACESIVRQIFGRQQE